MCGRVDDEMTQLGLLDEEEIALDEAALVLAMPDHPGLDPEPYLDLLVDAAARLEEAADGAHEAGERAAALAQVLGDEFGLAGDRDAYDDPANADMVRVLDRRRGLPVSLSILWVAAARRLGWQAGALDVPGHVLVLVGEEASPVIVDPFAGGARVDAARLAALLAAGGAAGGAARTVGVMPNRAVLVRLLLNQASRAENGGDRTRALELYRRMTLVSPGQAPLWWQRARLELATGQVRAARTSLAAVLEATREPELRRRAADVLEGLGAR